MAEPQDLRSLLYDAYKQGDDALANMLDLTKSYLTDAVAASIAADYAPAAQLNDLNGAKAAAYIAMRVYNYVHRPEDAFRCLLDSLSIHYFVANTEQAYADIVQTIRGTLHNMPSLATEPGTAVRAFTLAADSAYFASQCADKSGTEKQWVAESVDALASGRDAALDPAAAALLPPYASTAVADFKTCKQNGWTGESWAVAGFTRVCAALDTRAPFSLPYRGAGGALDATKTAYIHGQRLEMSQLYNSNAYDIATQKLAHLGLFGRKTL